MLKYLKAAFTNRWHLLALLGSLAAALIGPAPDVTLPLVLAAEAAFLATVAGHPKFQRYVDTTEHAALRQNRSQRGQRTLEHILRALPRPLINRYDQLRNRCRELQRIAADLRQPGHEQADGALESMQLANFDRLLWLYLRLLFTYHSLDKFLQQTSRDRIENDVDRIRNRLGMLADDDRSPHTQKIRRALTDNLATSQTRLENYDRARANYEFVELEIDRLENKIKSLAEAAVNRQEADYVSSQVDQVATSMLDTERTMNDLQVFTGLGQMDEEIPVLLDETLERQ